MIDQNRSLWKYILLSLVTCGIYSWFFIYSLANDVNTMCQGDGETTAGIGKYILLTLVTCGIYAFIWQYKLGNRLCTNAPRYGLTFQENGTTILMWDLFGILICGIGPFLAWNIIINNTNKIAAQYNNWVSNYR